MVRFPLGARIIIPRNEKEMNKKVITGVTLAVFMLGCGFSSADPSDEDVKKLNDRANAESAPVPTVPNKKIINGEIGRAHV